VEREHRDLDGEGQEERQEGQHLEVLAEGAGRGKRLELFVVESARPRARRGLVREGRGQDRHQHQQRADERVQHELHRRVDAVRAAPDADDQVHRDQDQLPEDVEEEEVEGDEDADHADFEDQEGDHVLLHADLDRPEAGEDADPAQRRRQGDHQHAQAVDAQLVLDAERRDPVDRFLELEAGLAAGEDREQDQGQEPGRQCRAEGRPPDEIEIVRGQHCDDQRAQERQEGDQAQDRQAGHRSSSYLIAR
jgi:hypothetical protein